ncbi:hypothetical protein [Roseomonas chloroacetimidivorans]|uniref:hypothetical protein n=1 Tax=Roseomonas chloroacetimidivorans TaxID=1766656 RepID=UPI003C79636D
MAEPLIRARPTEHHDAFVPVLQKPEYTMYLEQACGMTFAHCNVLVPWTKTLKPQFIADVQRVKDNHGGDIRIVVPEGDRKLAKFIGMIGFHYEETHTDAQGLNTHIYISPGRRNNEGRRDGKSILQAHESYRAEGRSISSPLACADVQQRTG